MSLERFVELKLLKKNVEFLRWFELFPKDYFFAVYCSTAHVDVSSVNLLTGLRVFTGHNLSGLFNVDELKK